MTSIHASKQCRPLTNPGEDLDECCGNATVAAFATSVVLLLDLLCPLRLPFVVDVVAAVVVGETLT